MIGGLRQESAPVVAVVSRAPLVAEAVREALTGFAYVRFIIAPCSDLLGLLAWMHPEAVVVEDEGAVAAAVEFGRAHEALVVHLMLDGERLRVLAGADWRELDDVGRDPLGTIRNVVGGGILGTRSRA